MQMKDVFVPDKNRLEYATDFFTGTVAVLKTSRLVVAWMSMANAVGAYEECLRYCMKRH